MKVLLSILCGLIVLFTGGCALLAIGGVGITGVLTSGPLALIPGGIAALNIMVLAALWGFGKPNKAVFVTLVVLDALVVVALAAAWTSVGGGDGELNVLASLIIAAFAVKGLLTAFYLRTI